ncbi:hypothetical protein L6164_020535 [Bauhinia variegata]|uniref:Uncharacterized protein n=1 Tax=Bauhinia variegata TaxID=167791 RepID=A0ACB9MW71_BAUVA|nr:hypothetical protein L6164_020535 [Bauhinia variegata]
MEPTQSLGLESGRHRLSQDLEKVSFCSTLCPCLGSIIDIVLEEYPHALISALVSLAYAYTPRGFCYSEVEPFDGEL